MTFNTALLASSTAFTSTAEPSTARPSPQEPRPAAGSMEVAADRLALLLTGGGQVLADPTGTDLEFEAEMRLAPLAPSIAPSEVWAVDGGQALVADARCLQVVVVRAAKVCFTAGACTVEDEGELSAWLLGPGAVRPGSQDAGHGVARGTAAGNETVPTGETAGIDETARSAGAEGVARTEGLGGTAGPRGTTGLGLGIAFDASIDVNLLRDRQEWLAVSDCVEQAEPGSIVLVDGDLQPDWRIPSSFLAGLLSRAAERNIVLAGVTKRSSLSRGGAPLISQLEADAEAAFGSRARWWTPVARTRPDVGHGVSVVAARLDPDARFAFRIDLPADPAVDPETVLGAIAAVSDDAAFPGYPYPLTVADRLAACPGWVRNEARRNLDDLLDRAGVALDVRERAFADRHDLMERY